MKKFLLFSFTFLFSIPVTQANFPDVPENHPNFEAITYLQSQTIIEGNPDGTFKPENTLNRAELTKIAILSANIPLQPAADCFPDVKSSDWFSTYVCTALQNQIIQGYPDGTFKPANPVNRAEALKIIAEAQSINTSQSNQTTAQTNFTDYAPNQWYSPYINYFSNQNYLPFPLKLQADKKLTRREFSEIYFRLLSTNQQTFQSEFPDTTHKLKGNPDEILQMLDLINQERTSRGLVPVVFSNELTYMAELHSQDMIDRNFFSHENPDGENIDTRRKDLNIQTFVGENISKNISVSNSHQSLMQSPPHKANILNPDWNRLGLGILKSSNGSYLISQEFSLFEVNTEKLINQIVSESNTTLQENSTLMSAAQKWAGIMATNQQTSTQINGQSLNDLDELQSLSIGAATGSASVSGDLEALVKGQLEFIQQSNTEFGYATAKDQTGQIYFILIYI